LKKKTEVQSAIADILYTQLKNELKHLFDSIVHVVIIFSIVWN
jgi:hypothetical protein